MQFFYIDYMKDGKKERNIGFLRVEQDGVSVGLRGVPAQCGGHCKVYAVNIYGETVLLGEVAIKDGYGMKKFAWKDRARFTECMRVEVPLYGSRKGVCVLRETTPAVPQQSAQDGGGSVRRGAGVPAEPNGETGKDADIQKEETQIRAAKDSGSAVCQDLYDEIHEDKWQQLLTLYPQIHICPEAQTILIRPKDVVILTKQFHELASNSFVLHAYYNYRQLLLFRYAQGTDGGGGGSDGKVLRSAEARGGDAAAQYYLGVPGVYYEREQRIAQMFGFEGFENGEARMQQDADRKVYKGCFGYYMKRVEI